MLIFMLNCFFSQCIHPLRFNLFHIYLPFFPMNGQQKCPKCPKPVSNVKNPLRCSTCKLIYHKKCCPLTQYELSKLTNSNLDWNCEDCMRLLFPFNGTDDNEFHSIFAEPGSVSVLSNGVTKNKCGNCLHLTLSLRKRL